MITYFYMVSDINNKKKFTILLLFTILVLFLIRLYNLSFFYTELDDLIAPYQLLIYENYNIYDIANDTKSDSYNHPIKIALRKIQSLNNGFINKFLFFFSDIFFNLAPSKHSTYAPLQFLLFGWLIDFEDDYINLKFYSRLPSVIFFFVAVILTYLISKKIFRNKFLHLFPSFLVSTSLTLFFISQRSYNYSAGVAGFLILVYLIILEHDSVKQKKFLIDNDIISIKKNFCLALIISLLGYLSYILVIFTPVIFLIFFIKNFLEEKKILTKFNINLIFTGFFYILLVSPLVLHIINLNLYESGQLQEASGFNNKYVPLNNIESNFSLIIFFLKNTLLIISKNTSFFLDNFHLSKFLQFLIIIFFIIGFVQIILDNNRKLKYFLIINVLLYFYWCLLAYLDLLTLGPTRHTAHFAPIFVIIISYGIYRIALYKKKYFINFFLAIFISIITIFYFNYMKYEKIYKDNFIEKDFVELIDLYEVNLIINSSSYSSSLCLMKSIKINIYTCPNRFERLTYKPKLSIHDLKVLKNNNSSIMLVNFFKETMFEESLIAENVSVYEKLNEFNFQEIYNQDKTLFIKDSPLRISEMTPNPFVIKIYK